MKISTPVSLFLFAASADAFVPTAQRTFVSRVSMSEETEAAAPAKAEAEPAPAPAPAPAPVPAAAAAPAVEGGALVPIKEETVEFAAGVVAGAVGLIIGGPVFGAVAAAAGNYASKMESDAGTVVKSVAKTSIEVLNYLSALDGKYAVLGKAQSSLTNALDKLKSQPNVNPETVTKVETALDSTKKKITEINDEYDLVGGGMTALGVVGDLVEKAVTKAGELNSEYKLSGKAMDSLKGAVDKAKEAADKATKN